MRSAAAVIMRIVILLATWEIVGHLHLVAQGALPPPSAILAQAWQDRDVYPPHIWATLQPAAVGFAIGNSIAVLAALVFVLVPPIERLMRGFSITLFAIPPIALGPLLVITLKGDWPQIALAAILVYFPTMIMTLLGLREVDPRPIDVIRCYGGGSVAVLRWLRWRSCLPGLLGGLRVAAPAAILGAILAEFGSGSRWGLGSFLLGSLGRANPPRIWGIGLSATLMAAIAYSLCALLARHLTASTTSVTIASSQIMETSGRKSWRSGSGFAFALGSFAMPFLLWWASLLVLQVSPVIAKTPLGVWSYLVSSPDAGGAWGSILSALGQSLPMAGLGLLIALIAALAFAVLSVAYRSVSAMVMPVALVLQTMPLVALTPMIVLIFGRGVTATLVVAVTVTFFPAFITIAQGLTLVPKPSLDLMDVYGASRTQKLIFVSLPTSLPYLCAAARLVAPAALLGVMIAEWLATGYGLGDLLNEARGELDYGMIWTVAFISVTISVAFYQVVRLIEVYSLRHYREMPVS